MPRKRVAVVLASGTGSRTGFARPKQLAKLGGRPLVAHSIERFQNHPGIDEIAVITNEICIEEIEALITREGFSKVKKVLLGGEERYQSSLTALEAYEADEAQPHLDVIFHDAVRPMVSQGVISDIIDALHYYDAVDTAVKAVDTVILADPDTNIITGIPDRAFARLGQTPQAFRFETIMAAYRTALQDPDFRTTDDCGVVLRYAPDKRIYVVSGDVSNMKLTYADDLMILDKYLQSSAGKRVSALDQGLLLSKLEKKVIVVVGGTSGIGASMVRLATAFGARVESAGFSTGLDIADADQVESFVKSVMDRHGRMDCMVNTAGILRRQPLMTMSSSDIEKSVATNVLGAMYLARSSYEPLKATRGHFMLYASSSYTYGRAYYSTYSASKAAIVNLTQALADEWFEAGIKVNCINPERARTPMRVKAFGQERPETLLDPEEVARKALGVLVQGTTGLIYDINRGF